MEVNFLAVILAGFSAFFLGFIWYTVVFAKPWQKEIGMKEQPAGGAAPDLGKQLVGSLILEMLMAFTLAVIIGSNADWQTGLVKGLMVGLGLVSFAFGVNYFFEGKTMKHWLINAGYNTVLFAIMGLIIGAL